MRDAAPAQLPDAWWCATIAATQAAVESGPGGLAADNARDRLARFGPNRFVDRPTRALWLDYLAHFRNPLVLVLLGAAAIEAATGEPIGSLIVIALVVASVTIDFVQERRANRVAEDLRATVAVHARVVRDGRELDVPVAEVVPGDVVLLAAGDLVPADGRVLEARDFFVQQANLTGEPYPVEKHAAELAPDAREPDAATNAVFMGTSVISGSARVLVCRTGATTRDRPHRRQPPRGRAAQRVRDRYAPLRAADHAAHAAPRPVRARS